MTKLNDERMFRLFMSAAWFLTLPVVASVVGTFALRRVSLGLQGIIVVLDALLVVGIAAYVDYYGGPDGRGTWNYYMIAYTVVCALPVIRVIASALRRFFYA